MRLYLAALLGVFVGACSSQCSAATNDWLRVATTKAGVQFDLDLASIERKGVAVEAFQRLTYPHHLLLMRVRLDCPARTVHVIRLWTFSLDEVLLHEEPGPAAARSINRDTPAGNLAAVLCPSPRPALLL